MKFFAPKIILFIGIFLIPINFIFAEKISNFDVKIKVNPDSSISVAENITYDFEGAEKHGIIRDIPVVYKTPTGRRKIDLKIVDVLRDGAKDGLETYRSGDNFSVKIGLAQEVISGSHLYSINYTVARALNYFEDFDELYWNATGNGWKIPIEKVSVRIELPNGVDPFFIRKSCYQGLFGSREGCPADIIGLGNIIQSKSGQTLNSGEGLTVAIGFPKGFVSEPNTSENIINWLKDNGIIFLPVLVFIFMFGLWWKKGRDPKGRGTIIAEYEPPRGMKPTLVGSLIDEKVDDRDITAGLIYLAEQGFVKIKRLENSGIVGWLTGIDYELTLLKDESEIPEKIEKDIAKLFFYNPKAGAMIKLSEIKKTSEFRKKALSLKSDIYEEMVTGGYFIKNPRRIIVGYVATGILVGLIGSQIVIFFGGVAMITSFISGLIIIIFGLLMKKKTPLGAETKDELRGFKEFLSMTEKDRLDFHNAPGKSPEQFMQFLPFAIAMGVENKWADQFKDVYINQPSWYEGKMSGAFVVSAFSSDLSKFNSSLSGSLASATASRGGSGSSGGGFSGGGFGGGGGGSW